MVSWDENWHCHQGGTYGEWRVCTTLEPLFEVRKTMNLRHLAWGGAVLVVEASMTGWQRETRQGVLILLCVFVASSKWRRLEDLWCSNHD